MAGGGQLGRVSGSLGRRPAQRPSETGFFRRVPAARAYAWHLAEAETARAAGQWAAAAFHLDRVSAAEPPDLAARQRRGRLHVLRGDSARAHADYAALFAATEPDEIKAWLDYARLLLLRHDHAGFRRLIPRMITHCGARTDLSNPEPEEAQTSALAPGGAENPVELIRFADRAFRDSHNAPGALWSLSLAHYRAGQAEKAAARAEEAIALRPDLAWLSWPILALAHAQLGHADEASRWLAKTRDWHQGQRRRQVTESAKFTPPEWADFEITYREAAASVGGPTQ